jgi:hypothetical protein
MLTLSASTVSSNTAGYGGGVENSGYSGSATLTVSNCTLSGNSAGYGGGMYNNGASFGIVTVQIANSTLSGNLASGNGGCIYNDGESSGNGMLTLSASTLTGNSASKGGGCIFNDGYSVEIGSTILKAGAVGANIANISGTVNSDGYNLASDAGGGFLTGTADQIHTDPMLGPLQDNGGPTFTHALLPGSPAIDKGKNLSGYLTDQRGFPRTVDACIDNAPGGDGTDIGAFEVQQPQLTILLSGVPPSGIVLTWPTHVVDYSGYTLQSAPASTGPFTNLPAGTNPYTSPITGAQQFYRLVR